MMRYINLRFTLHYTTNMSTNPENLTKIGFVVSEISLLQEIVKEEEDDDDYDKRTAKKVTLHKLVG